MQVICSSSSDQMAGQSGVVLITGSIESSSVSSDWVFSWPAVTESTNIKGHAFDWRSTAVLTIIVTALTLASAGLHAWYGEQGVWIASAIAGLADAHSNIASITALQSKG